MVEPRTLVASRAKTVGLLAIGLGFVAIALFLPRDGGDQQWRWWCGGLFGLCTLVFGFLLARPHWVALDAEGFTVGGGLTRAPRRVRWADVEGFFLHRLPRGGTMIGYTLTEAARPDSYLGDLSHRLGPDGVLPGTLAGRRDAIVAELNAYRTAALGR